MQLTVAFSLMYTGCVVVFYHCCVEKAETLLRLKNMNVVGHGAMTSSFHQSVASEGSSPTSLSALQLSQVQRNRQLWGEVRSAMGAKLLREETFRQVDAGVSDNLADLHLLTPPPFRIGEPLRLPYGRSAEACMERFLESAGNTLPASDVVKGLEGMHRLLLDAPTLHWFTCAFWAVVTGYQRVLTKKHTTGDHVVTEDEGGAKESYLAALFLNMSFFFHQSLQSASPALKQSQAALLDVCRCMAGAVVHAARSFFTRNAPQLDTEDLAFTHQAETWVMTWCVGLDTVRAPAPSSSDVSHPHTKSSVTPAGAPSNRTNANHPGVSVSDTMNRLRDMRRSRDAFDRAIRSLSVGEDAPRASHLGETSIPTNAGVLRSPGGESRASGIVSSPSGSRTPTFGAASHAAAGIGNPPSRAPPATSVSSPQQHHQPLVSRNTAIKRAAPPAADSAGGDGALLVRPGEGRVAFDEIHEKVKLTEQIKKQVIERKKAIAEAAKRAEVQRKTDADAYALAHMITADGWKDPQRHAVRTFHLNAVSPLMKLLLLVANRQSVDVLQGAIGTRSVHDGRRDISASLTSTFQRINATPVSRLSTPVRLRTVVVKSTRQAHDAEPHSERMSASTLFGNEWTSVVWVCGPATESQQQQQPNFVEGVPVTQSVAGSPTAGSIKRTFSHASESPRGNGSNVGSLRRDVVARWSQVMQDLVRESRQVPEEQARFLFCLREVNASIREINLRSAKAAEEAVVDALQMCVPSDAPTEVTMVAAHQVEPSHRVTLRPKSQGVSVADQQTLRPCEELPHAPLGSFLIGTPVSKAPDDPLKPTTLLQPRLEAASMWKEKASHIARPLSAQAGRLSLTPSSLRASSAARRPHSAMSRSDSSSVLKQRHAPASGTLFGSEPLSIRQRPASATIKWTGIVENDTSALQKFIDRTKASVAASLKRVNALNVQAAEEEAAHRASHAAFKANSSRYAVEHLQEIKRSETRIHRERRDAETRAMAAITEAAEAAAHKQHNELRQIDLLKEALYQVDSNFDDLPELFRQQILVYVARCSAELNSRIRSYKLAVRDKSLWPAGLDDLRCSREREGAKYGIGAVYHSPRKTRYGVSDASPEDIAAAMSSEASFRDQESAASHEHDYLLNAFDEGVDGAYYLARDPVEVEASIQQLELTAGDARPEENDPVGNGDDTAAPHGEDILETLRQRAPIESEVEICCAPLEMKSEAKCSDAAADVDDYAMVDPMVPPRCVPAASVSSTHPNLVSRAGVLMWDDSNQMVGRRARELRTRIANKRTAVPDVGALSRMKISLTS